jgi:hypothetical protein
MRAFWMLVCALIAAAALAVTLSVAGSPAHGAEPVSGPEAALEVDAGCVDAPPLPWWTPGPSPTPAPTAGPYAMYIPRLVKDGMPGLWCSYKVAPALTLTPTP